MPLQAKIHAVAFMDHCRRVNAVSTSNQYGPVMDAFAKFAYKDKDQNYGVGLVRRFCDKLGKDGYSASVVKQAEAAVRSFYSWLQGNEIIQYNPMLGVKKLVIVGPPMTPTAHFTRDEYERIKDVSLASKHNYWTGACIVAWNTGLRLGDVSNLKWADVDILSETISLTPRKTVKTGRRVQIPIAQELRDYLIAAKAVYHSSPPEFVFPMMARNYKYDGNVALSLQFHALCSKAKIRGKSFHSFRRSFNTRAIEAGVAPAIISQMTGQDISTVMRYVRIGMDVKKAAMELMNRKQ